MPATERMPSQIQFPVNGVLYGTTQEGGVCDPYCGYGTVFELSPSGSESVLHSFSGGGFYNAPDGGYPQAGLVDLNGTMYGTTADGGGTACVEGNGSSGCGTVFDVGASGSESVLYRFKGKTGAYPTGDLVSAKGALFGTTDGGGDSGSGSGGCSGNHAFRCGVVFELSTKGKEHVLHFFKGGSDGWGPLAGIVAVNGTLYGYHFQRRRFGVQRLRMRHRLRDQHHWEKISSALPVLRWH